jgi:hypothetical protein
MEDLNTSRHGRGLTGALCTPVQPQGTKKNLIVVARFFFCFLMGYGK